MRFEHVYTMIFGFCAEQTHSRTRRIGGGRKNSFTFHDDHQTIVSSYNFHARFYFDIPYVGVLDRERKVNFFMLQVASDLF